MPTSSTLLAVSILGLVLLAGCAGGSAKTDAPPVQPSSEIKATGSAIEGTSTITGIVIDDQTAPIQGVTIGIQAASVGTQLQVVSDAAGQFVVSNIVGGKYQVFAQKLGYGSAAKAVDVAEGEVASVTLTLAAIAIEDVFYDVIGPYSGFLACGYTEPGVSGVKGAVTYQCPGATEAAFGDAVNNFEFELKQSNYNAIMGELRWTPSAGGTSQRLSLFMMPDDGGGRNWYCMAGGTSPVTMVYTIDEEKDGCDQRGGDPDPEVPEMDTPLVLTVYLPFDSINPSAVDQSSPPNVVFQQNYQSIATVFYGMDKPEIFSSFADA